MGRPMRLQQLELMGCLILPFLILVTCSLIDRSLHKIEFKGFIYPYSVYTIKAPNRSHVIVFESIATQEVLPHLTLTDHHHLQAYSHIESFLFPPNNFTPTEITVKDNLFIISCVSSNISWSIAYLKQPHLHKFYTISNSTQGTKEYVSFFQRRQQPIKFQNSYLFDACELWRAWVFVRLEQSEGEFSIFIKKEPGGSLARTYNFIREYFTSSPIRKIILQKHSASLTLELILVSDQDMCLFHISSNLSLLFHSCSKKQDIISECIPISPSTLLLFYQQTPTTPIYKAQIIQLQHNQPLCSITFPNIPNQPYIIHKLIHNRIIVCTQSLCHSYSFACQKVVGLQQIMTNITNIQYQRIQHQYIQYIYSSLIIYSNDKVLMFTECDDPSLYQPTINMCRKPIITPVAGRYDGLSCYQCSRTPQCYFLQNKARYLPGKEVEFFDTSVYEDKEQFVQQYYRFQAGVTSNCGDRLNCTLVTEGYKSWIKVDQQENMQRQMTCELMFTVTSESQHAIFFHRSQMSVSICYSDFRDSLYTCDAMDIPGQFRFPVSDYVLFLITARRPGVISITNLYEQNLHTATNIFILFACFAISASIIAVLIFLFKNTIMMQLAIWGCIQFKLSGKYPLTKSELNLKLSYLLKYKYITELSRSSKDLEECCFCLEQVDPARSSGYEIYCRHQFHKNCLNEWFQLEPKSYKCPICKRLFDDYSMQTFINQNHMFNRRSSDLTLLSEGSLNS